jgi:hypothetical protein
MNRMIKALGISLVAVFAMSAVTAQGAWAEEAEFVAAEYPAHIDATGETDQAFESSVGEFGCTQEEESPSLHGTAILEEPSPELTGENIEHTNCHALDGVFPVTIETGGCHYQFTAGTKTVAASEGSLHIKCPEGHQITITIFQFGSTTHHPFELICEIHIPEQTPSGTVTFHNITENNKEALTAKAEGLAIQAEITESSICEAETSEIVYTGAFVATATNEAEEQIDVTVE